MAKLTTPHDFVALEKVTEATLDKIVQMLTFAINNNDDEFIAHKSGTDHDTRYYTKTQIDVALALKATLDVATSTTKGLMSASDKAKMDVLSTTQPMVDYATIQTNLDSHIVEDSVYDYELFDKDNITGIYMRFEEYRSDNSLFRKTVLSNPNASGYPQTETVTRYGTDGVTVLSTEPFILVFDADGNLYKRDKVVV